MMSLEEPTCLPVGTEVSAKYRGAFCEAKVKKVVKTVKVKVNLKDGGSVIGLDEHIKGPVRMGAIVEIKHPETSQYMEGTITRISDASMYTVVFDDGDENTLRRTQLCLKGEKHFVKTDTLDELPLTHPEHFGTPVMKGSGRKRRRSPASAMSDDSDSEDESSEEELPKRRYGTRLEGMVGRVVLMEIEERKRSLLVPVLITQPSADENMSLKTREHILVKSFKDSKFYAVNRKQTKEFIPEMAAKNDEKALKNAFEKALQYYSNKDLPVGWDREDLLGSESEDEEDEEEESSDDEPNEEKDRFVAQLYKFMDDRGTPINKVPTVGARDLNLYRLFRILQNLGGYNRVTNQMKWRLVQTRMGLPPSTVAANQIKAAYKKYLHAFEDFYRKLGSTMGTISRPIRSPRSHVGGRSIIRERDREGAPKSPGRAKKKKEEEEPAIIPKIVKEEKPLERTEMKTRSKKEEPSAENKDEEKTDSPRKRTRGTIELEKTKVKEETSKIEQPAVLPSIIKRPGSREESKRANKDDSSTGSRQKDDETTSEGGVEDTGRPPRRRIRKKRFGEEDEEEPLPPKPKPKAVEKVIKPEPIPAPSSSEDELEDDKSNGDKEEDERRSNPPREAASNVEFPIGSRLRVRYDTGKVAEVYDAKVVETQLESGVTQYKVHYAGWNMRYDEWVQKDRIVSVVDRGKGASQNQQNKIKEKKTEKQPVRQISKPGISVQKPCTISPSLQPSLEHRSRKSPTPSASSNNSLKPPRPTRSTSLENPLVQGLPPRTVRRRKQRVRRSSGVAESDLQSRDSSISGSEESEDDEPSLPDQEDEKLIKTEHSEEPLERLDEELEETTSDQPEKLAADLKHEDPLNKHGSSVSKSPRQPVVEMEKVSQEVISKVIKSPPKETTAIKPQDSASPVSSRQSVKDTRPARLLAECKETDSGKDSECSESDLRTPSKRRPGRKRLISESKDSEELKKESEKVSVKEEEKSDSKIDEIQEESRSAKKRASRVFKGGDKEKLVDAKTKVKGKRKLVDKSDDTEDTKSESESITKKVRRKNIKKKEDEEENEPETLVSKQPLKPEKQDTIVAPTPSDSILPVSPLYKPAPQLTLNLEQERNECDENAPAPHLSPIIHAVQPKPLLLTPATVAQVPSSSAITTTAADSHPSVSCALVSQPVVSSPQQVKEQSVVPSTAVVPELVVSSESSVKSTSSEIPISSMSQSSSQTVSTTTTVSSAPIMSSTLPLETSIPTPPCDTKDSIIPDSPSLSPQTDTASSLVASSIAADASPIPEQPTEELGSTKSEQEANMEVEKLMSSQVDSPTACDMSTTSMGSGGGSSGNAPGSESDDQVNTTKTPPTSKRKIEPSEEEEEEEEEEPMPKRRRRGKRIPGSTEKTKRIIKPTPAVSDSDEGIETTTTTRRTHALSSTSAGVSCHGGSRSCKYNFLDFGEAKYYQGEKRIEFLVDRIKELRNIYMNIKAEVATIDRKRKRARRREREAQANASQQEAVEG